MSTVPASSAGRPTGRTCWPTRRSGTRTPLAACSRESGRPSVHVSPPSNSSYCDPSPDAAASITELFHLPAILRKSSSQVAIATTSILPQEFFLHGVLAQSSSVGELGWGNPAWLLALCLAVTWTVNFLCLFKVLSPGRSLMTMSVQGIKTSGKVVYFTATFPYLVIVILLVRAATLDGAMKGIEFYLNPDWSELGKFSVWVTAAGQILFSLSHANATMPTLASYNPFHKNVIFDVFLVCTLNCLTSFVAGFAIFGTLGHLALVLGQEVKTVATKGAGLAFMAYPDLVRLPALLHCPRLGRHPPAAAALELPVLLHAGHPRDGLLHVPDRGHLHLRCRLCAPPAPP